MKSLSTILLLLLVITTQSCSKKLYYFTEQLQDDFDWTKQDLEQIQFYLSEDIVLVRELSREEAKITDGKIKISGGTHVEELRFEKDTPGILMFIPKEDRFAISFEDGKHLMFGPNEKANGRFVLLAKKWSVRSGLVTYGDKVYDTPSKSAYAALLVDVDNIKKTKYKVKKPKGRKVD